MKTITGEIIKQFELYLYEAEKSDSTIEKYLRDIRSFSKWLHGRSANKSLVLAYKKILCENYLPSSVNSILSSLNALFVYLNWYDLKVRTLKIQRRIFADKEKELTKTEYERLLSAAKNKNNERLYYLIQVLGSTGIRVSELKYVTCEAVAAAQATIRCKGKIRQVFFPKRLCKILKVYIKHQNIKSGPVFITKTGTPLDRTAVWKMLKTLCEYAKVPKCKVFPHNFRHLFAKTFYSLQKDIVRLADILGHSSIETTRIYTIETGDIHRQQIEQMHLLRC